MNIALLFNSDHPALGGWYGGAVMDRILGTNELQAVNRSMRISVGDVLTYSAASRSKTPTLASLVQLCQAVYRPKDFDRLILDRLNQTHGKATVYCWLFQNMTASIGDALHSQLHPDPTYLGAMDVDFLEPLHLYFFRNSLVEQYRLHGKRCSIFYGMGSSEDPDLAVQEIFESHGFSINYEDTGARRTIFDNYDTLEHFRRVEDFKRIFAQFDGLDEARTSDLALNLEELHPALFNAFASAARALERAETEEDYAQAALSGRRLLERTADYLFPPQEEKWNGRKVGPAQYKNRLWAYIAQTIAEAEVADSGMLERLGKEADRLVDLFNAGLHANPTRQKVESSFRDLVVWLSSVIEISPDASRRPYLAYNDELFNFFLKDDGASGAESN